MISVNTINMVNFQRDFSSNWMSPCPTTQTALFTIALNQVSANVSGNRHSTDIARHLTCFPAPNVISVLKQVLAFSRTVQRFNLIDFPATLLAVPSRLLSVHH